MTEQDRPTTPKKTRRKRPKLQKERPAPETVDSDWRMFLAVPLPKPVVEQIDAIIAELQPHDWPVRWVNPETAHLTLHFLGDTPPEQVSILRMMLPVVVAEHEAFELRTAGLGVFPKLKKPRVLWLGLWGPAHRLESLHDALGNTLAEMQFPIEEKPFQSHITLGRLRNIHNAPMRQIPAQLREAIAGLERSGLADPKHPLPVPVDEILLIRSHLERTGARHEVIDRFPLKTQSSNS